MVDKIIEKLAKIIKKSMKIHQNSSKNEVRRGPRGSWEGSWGHSGPQGCSRDERCQKGKKFNPPPGTKLEAKIHTLLIFLMLFCDLFLDQRLGRLPDQIFMDFG